MLLTCKFYPCIPVSIVVYNSFVTVSTMCQYEPYLHKIQPEFMHILRKIIYYKIRLNKNSCEHCLEVK